MIFSEDYFKQIRNKDDFLSFVDELKTDYASQNDFWHNKTILDYLESMQSWLNDTQNVPFCTNDSEANWSLIALLFYIGKIYE